MTSPLEIRPAPSPIEVKPSPFPVYECAGYCDRAYIRRDLRWLRGFTVKDVSGDKAWGRYDDGTFSKGAVVEPGWYCEHCIDGLLGELVGLDLTRESNYSEDFPPPYYCCAAEGCAEESVSSPNELMMIYHAPLLEGKGWYCLDCLTEMGIDPEDPEVVTGGLLIDFLDSFDFQHGQHKWWKREQ